MTAKWTDFVSGAVLTAAQLNDVLDNFQDQAIFREEQANNTNGGNNTASTWTKRTLNTTVVNNIGATLSSSVVTLPAGTYYVHGRCPLYNVDRCKSRIQNTTAGTTTIVGDSDYAHPTNGGYAFATVEGLITVASNTNFELQSWGRDTATNGLGIATNASTTEVYSTLRIVRIA